MGKTTCCLGHQMLHRRAMSDRQPRERFAGIRTLCCSGLRLLQTHSMTERPFDHLLREPAQVFILTGDQPRRERRVRLHGSGEAWGLWALRSGVAQLQGAGWRRRKRVVAPALVCLQPGRGDVLDIPPAADYRYLSFTVCWVPRRRVSENWDAWTSGGHSQPDSLTWLPHDLPRLVPPPHRESGISMVTRACQEWWLGPLRRLRASAWLAAWFYDWVIAQETTDEEDPWQRLARVARERLAKGVTITELAVEAGCSRAQLFRRMRAELQVTPRVWLDTIRRERAERLLADPLADPAMVAKQCGFRNCKAFRRWLARV